MSAPPYGWLRKDIIAPVPEITDEQAEAILSGKDRVYCEAYKCNLKADLCASFYNKAKENSKHWRSSVGSTHRAFCLKCEIGKKNAAKIKTESLACHKCGRDLTSGDLKKKYKMCSYCRASKTSESRRVIKAKS